MAFFRVALVLFFVCVVKGVTGQFPYLGKCPSPEVQENFDMEKFKGTWYEIERTMSFLEIGAQCVSTNFSDAGYEDGSIEVINEGKSAILKIAKRIRLIATVPDEKEPAKMLLRLSDLKLHGNYWILSTDYDNYALVWSCNHIWLTFQYTRTENLWILSRKRTLPEETIKELHALLEEKKDIKAKKLLRKVKQENCE